MFSAQPWSRGGVTQPIPSVPLFSHFGFIIIQTNTALVTPTPNQITVVWWRARNTKCVRLGKLNGTEQLYHDDVIKWKHFPHYWPFARGIHRSPVNSPHKDQWRGALMFSLISVWRNGWVNNREAGDLRRYLAHCDVTVMIHSKRSNNKYILCQAPVLQRNILFSKIRK